MCFYTKLLSNSYNKLYGPVLNFDIQYASVCVVLMTLFYDRLTEWSYCRWCRVRHSKLFTITRNQPNIAEVHAQSSVVWTKQIFWARINDYVTCDVSVKYSQISIFENIIKEDYQCVIVRRHCWQHDPISVRAKCIRSKA